MYKRSLKPPDHSFFLFGPRGTGKTTWLKQVLSHARWYDLLRNDHYISLLKDPSLLRREVEATANQTWFIVDEIQRIPALLNEIHSIIAEHGSRFLFALSGSSARKLKRDDANLLAGRAITRQFFPLTGSEMGYDFDLERVLRFGALPGVVTQPSYAVDILEAYVQTYLQQEIQMEAAARNLVSFSRFLEVAALANGKVTNVSNIARECGISRSAVQNYFDILVSTLIGYWLPAWQPRVKVREIAHPKFYFFDPGVVSAIAGRIREPLDRLEQGPLLETVMLNELRSFQNVSNCGGKLHYWATTSDQEVDFVWTRGNKAVGIEVKCSSQWRSKYGSTLKRLHDEQALSACYGVFCGERALKDGPLLVLPVKEFMRKLSDGEIIG